MVWLLIIVGLSLCFLYIYLAKVQFFVYINYIMTEHDNTHKDDANNIEPKEQKDDEPKPVKIESIDVKPKKNKCIRCVWRTVLNTIEVIIDGVICCCRCTKTCLESIDCDSDDE